MTEPLFREDAYLRSCGATVVATGPDGIVLDRTVFYPEGGGQPGDSGRLVWAGGATVIANTKKAGDGDDILHVPADGAPFPPAGTTVEAEIDWDRRYRHMRMHTCLHLLCAAVDGDVTGGQIGEGKGRLDFNLPDRPPDKHALAETLNGMVSADHPVEAGWIGEDELAARPELVRTMSVKPPSGAGRIRVLRIGDGAIDLQPCGGTHVRSTGEIGTITVGKIENKGRQNRRITLTLAD